MIKNTTLLLTLSFLIAACDSYPPRLAIQSKEISSSELVYWNSPQSMKRFNQSAAKIDFFSLSNYFETQNNGLFCGLASSAIVLNALQLNKVEKIPEDHSSIQNDEKKYLPRKHNPYLKKYTQKNILNAKTKSKKEILGKPLEIEEEMKNDFGLQLHQLAQVLRANGAKVEMRAVSDRLGDEKVRHELIENLKSETDYVLVNYKRSLLGQEGGGHISPLGAYHKESDSFLIMDVNPNRALWVWVSAKKLIAAMRSYDTIQNRGYVMVK